MIVAGCNKEKLKFYLIKKPQIILISKKEELKEHKKQIRAKKDHIRFLPLPYKEKSLYILSFLENKQVGVE